MIYNIIKKIYLSYFLNSKLIKKFILKSYNNLNLDESLKKNHTDTIEKRFLNTNLSAIIHDDLLKKNISNKSYSKVFILTDQNYEINTKFIDHLDIKKIQSVFDIKKNEIKNSLFFIFFSSDELALPQIEEIIKNEGYFKSLDYENLKFNSDYSKATSYRFVNQNCLKAIKKTFLTKKRISGNYISTLNTHENICEAIELTKNLEGDYVEIGVFEGGSALTALNYLRLINLKRRVFLLDTFEGFNYVESEKSLDVKWYKSHFIEKETETKKLLNDTLKEFNNYELITNNICKDELPNVIENISLAHIDVDMYEATCSALEKVGKKIVKNGIIICEDPTNTPMLYGALYAMEKFLDTEEGKKFIKIFKKNHYFLIKQN